MAAAQIRVYQTLQSGLHPTDDQEKVTGWSNNGIEILAIDLKSAMYCPCLPSACPCLPRLPAAPSWFNTGAFLIHA